MPEKYIVANTCEDRCGIIRTDEVVDGHPVYRCPGCDSRWYDTDEKPQARRGIGGITGHLPSLSRRGRRG